MKLSKVFPKREKYLWISLALMLLGSLAMVNVPLKSQEYQTRLYIRESPPGSWIPGVPVGELVWVTVDIEIPQAWDNTPQGMVGWAFFVHVDPDVLTPIWVYGNSSGYFLYDFCDWNGYLSDFVFPSLLWGPIDPTTGDIRDICEFILGYPSIGVGAGGSSGPGWYGETYGLCRLLFRSKSETATTLIDIYDAEWSDANGEWHPFDVIDDGQYNRWPRPPVAIIEGPPQGYVNMPVTFDGSYSYDPDGGSIVSYLWDFGDGTVISTTNPTIVYTYASIGTYEVTLVVTDDENQKSDPATCEIRIKSPIEGLQELIVTIKSWNLPKGTENSLTAKLEVAIHLLNKGNENGAIRALMDFISKVEVLRNKGQLEDWQADHLITEAQKIIGIIEG
jgi:hypothetical protein